MHATAATSTENTMQDDEDETAPKAREEGRGAVDGAGQHRCQDEPQDGIERRLLGKKSTVPAADDDERRGEDDDAPKADLKEGEAYRLAAQPEKRFETCDHSRHLNLPRRRVTSICLKLQAAGGSLGCAVDRSARAVVVTLTMLSRGLTMYRRPEHLCVQVQKARRLEEIFFARRELELCGEVGRASANASSTRAPGRPDGWRLQPGSDDS